MYILIVIFRSLLAGQPCRVKSHAWRPGRELVGQYLALSMGVFTYVCTKSGLLASGLTHWQITYLAGGLSQASLDVEE